MILSRFARFSVILLLSTCTLLFLTHAAKAQDDDPISLFNLGQDVHEKGDFKKAIELYDAAIKLLPDFPEAEYQRAMAFLSLGNTEEAERGFQRAIQLRPDWSLPIIALAQLQASRGKFDESERLLVKALELDPANPNVYALLAEIRLKNENASSEALQTLHEKIKAFLEKANANAQLWAVRAALERRLNDKKSAKESLNQALRIDPKNFLALSEKIEFALAENDISEAVAQAENLVRIYPNSTSAKILLARALLADAKISEAKKLLEGLDPSNPDVQKIKRAIETQNSTDLASLGKQLADNPNDLTILARLCSLTRKSSPTKAVEYCRRYFDLEPDVAAVAYGSALVQAKDYEKAIEVLQKALAKSPDNYTARANLATALFQLKRYKEAEQEYKWLAEKNPNSAVVYYFLAISKDNLGKYEEALLSYQHFLRLADPEKYKLEIENVKFRLPVLQRKIEKK